MTTISKQDLEDLAVEMYRFARNADGLNREQEQAARSRFRRYWERNFEEDN